MMTSGRVGQTIRRGEEQIPVSRSNTSRTPVSFRMLPPRPAVLCGLALLLSLPALAIHPSRAAENPAPPLYALLVGGGPDVASNAAQIEGHVHFVASLLPPATVRTVLFADGKPDQPTVSYADPGPPADAQRTLSILLADQDAEEPVLTRPPQLGVPLDGPARSSEIHRALARLSTRAAGQPAPLLLYFAGHGTQDDKNEANTRYDLWDNDTLKVRALADELSHLPRSVPVVLVMAQCFSGAFADVLFTHADPKSSPTNQNLVGFFSAQKDQEAAGCSYATDQADYQDFSSYFFGALCGQDRFGGKITGADYDGDGKVTLHEAFCYALIHDPSADTPVCTSDIFLQQAAPLPDATIYGTSYHEAWQSATPAQRAVLDALSDKLGLVGEARALTVYDRLTYGDPAARPALLQRQSEAKAELNALRTPALATLFHDWPALRWGNDDTDESRQATEGALGDLAKDATLRQKLQAAEQTHEQADEGVDDDEAALVRFANLYEHLVEVENLRHHGKPETRARFDTLWKAEAATLPLDKPL